MTGDFNATEIVIYTTNVQISNSDQIQNVSSTTCVSNLYCTYSSQYISFVDMLQIRILFSDQILINHIIFLIGSNVYMTTSLIYTTIPCFKSIAVKIVY